MTISIFKQYTMQDDIYEVLNFNITDHHKQKEIITGWRDAGYVVKVMKG